VTEGVRLDQLCCPTCGEPYSLPLQVTADNDLSDFDVDAAVTAIMSRPKTPWRYVVKCPNGHRWTIKQIQRMQGAIRPDKVLLGEYIGND
jgi:hypothetical protein